MRIRFVVLAAAAWVLTTAAFAANDHAYLGVFAETSSTKMIGMPAMPELPPEMDLSTMPGMANMLAMYLPQRKLTVRLWSPSIAPPNAAATLAVPVGLKQGPQLNLDLYRPKPGQTEAESDSTGTVAQPTGQFTIKRYWGSSETVKAGQPLVTTINYDSLTPEQKTAMREMQDRARKQGSYFYKPNWTTGYWPTPRQPGAIAKDAALPGTYSLTTNYTGNVDITVPDTVQFLAPIVMETPALDQAPPLTAALDFHWKLIAGALGLDAQIMGMQGNNTLILWSSSEIPTAGFSGVEDYLQMAEVAERVNTTEFMAGARQDVAVPAGIFQDCDFVNLSMVGYGPGAARNDTDPLARVQTKTTLRIMLGGKKMPTGMTH
jgi:hypothetical protein